MSQQTTAAAMVGLFIIGAIGAGIYLTQDETVEWEQRVAGLDGVDTLVCKYTQTGPTEGLLQVKRYNESGALVTEYENVLYNFTAADIRAAVESNTYHDIFIY